MQMLLLLAMLLAGAEPNHAAAASTPIPGIHNQAAEQPSLNAAADITPFITEGDSMSPAIDSGDRLNVDKGYYRSHKPERGDIIVFRAPDERLFVKRIVGLPGETIRIERSELYVGGKLAEDWPLEGNASSVAEVKLSGKQLFVLGDNYAHSYDSRYIGPIETDNVVGKVIDIEHKRQSAPTAFNKPAYWPLQPNVRQTRPDAKSLLAAGKSIPASVNPPKPPKRRAAARSPTSHAAGRWR